MGAAWCGTPWGAVSQRTCRTHPWGAARQLPSTQWCGTRVYTLPPCAVQAPGRLACWCVLHAVLRARGCMQGLGACMSKRPAVCCPSVMHRKYQLSCVWMRVGGCVGHAVMGALVGRGCVGHAVMGALVRRIDAAH